MQIAHALERPLPAKHDDPSQRRFQESILIPASKDKVAKLGNTRLTNAFELGSRPNISNKPGDLVADIAYMAPERTKSDAEADTRSDIYGA